MTVSTSPPADFGTTIAFVEERAVLAARGEIDCITAPDFGAALDAVIDQGHAGVVLDVAQLKFIGAAGLRVIAVGASRLAIRGRTLAIRSPSPMLARLLDVSGLIGAVQLTPSAPALSPEQPPSSGGAPQSGEVTALVQHLRTASAIPADHDVVDAALRLVVALARATVGGADGVSVSLRRHGRLATVAASDRTISDMDANQYATGEGPCVDASETGHWSHAESLGTEARWPAFTPRALALGINAILSSPLFAKDRPVGALNIYSRTGGSFAVKDQELAAVFASEASIMLIDAAVGASGEELAVRLATALRARQTIAQATGILMGRHGISEDDAYSALRHLSVRAGQPLAEGAAEVVRSARRPLRSVQPDHGGPDG